MPIRETRLRTAGHDGGVTRCTGVRTGDDPAAWTALGFAVEGDRVPLGGFDVVCDGSGGGPAELVYDAAPAAAGVHPNGCTGLDHVVLFTPSVDASVERLAGEGWDLRRRAAPPAVPLEMAFVRSGDVILEVAQHGEAERLWGLTVVVADLDACVTALGERVGRPRQAVQPGRRIATARSADGLGTALAFMTPRT